MLQVEIQAPDGVTTLVQAPDDSVIGKGVQSEIRLNSCASEKTMLDYLKHHLEFCWRTLVHLAVCRSTVSE